MDRIPTRFETFDERFRGCNGDDWVIPIFSDGRWTEGPAWFPAHRVLVFSDSLTIG